MIAALFVPWCLAYWGNDPGWKYAFIITGALGFIWLFFWFALYNSPSKHKKLSKEEFDYIHSDDVVVQCFFVPPAEDVPFMTQKIPWVKLLNFPQTWAFFMGKFLTDGVWWFLLFWLPDYLKKQFGMTGEQVMWPTFIVYGIAIFGSTFGGSIPLFLINKGMSVYKARMTAMLIIALFPILLLSTQYFGNVAVFGSSASIFAIGVICIAAAAHQAWSANLFTTVSDMFPKRAVGSVIGIGTMAGGVGGFIIQEVSRTLNRLIQSHTTCCLFNYVYNLCIGLYYSLGNYKN